IIMPILINSEEALSDAMLKKAKRLIELSSKTPNNVEILLGTQNGIWGLFGDMIIVSWLVSDTKPDYKEVAMQDAAHIAEQLPTIISEIGLPEHTTTRYTVYEGKLIQHRDVQHTTSLASQWRTLFSQAVIQLEQQ
ncbi:MAG TPA: molecular chaperone TorD, partial [Methylophilaceae bacterium]|nr:molecular chaperone TorD [Methylophilaceae bacterium]